MITNNLGNPNGEILFITNTKCLNIDNYQTFHNLITYRKTNKKHFFKNDFYIIDTNNLELEKVSLNRFNLIIISSNKTLAKEIRTLYNVKESSLITCNKDKYLFFENFEKKKVIIQLEHFNSLSEEVLKELVWDLRYHLVYENHYFPKTSIFGNKDIFYYQWECIKCNNHNLAIVNKSEPKPNKCTNCNKSILDLEGKLNTEILVLNNNELKTISTQL